MCSFLEQPSVCAPVEPASITEPLDKVARQAVQDENTCTEHQKIVLQKRLLGKQE